MTYIVKPGDTLYGISNQFGVSVTELAELNNISGSNLKIGEELKIPSQSGTNPNNMFMYTVKPGDTLYSIAQKYGTTVKDIQNLNYLSSVNLKVGQVLRIPETYTKEDEMVLPMYINYAVKPGDTLYLIAKNNNIDVDTLIKDNGLTSNNLKVGQNLKIRVTEKPEDIEECFGDGYIKETDAIGETYIVKSGDSLYSIARKFNTTVDSIKALNNLSGNSLKVGQKLIVPSLGTNTTYIVKSGDSLYSIAKKFNTTVNSIISKNNLKSNLLSVGQKLKI